MVEVLHSKDFLVKIEKPFFDFIFILFPDPWPKKKHWKRQGGYEKTSRGEGCSLIDGHNLDNIKLLECKNMLYCICHDNNTINKDRFNNENDNQEHMEISDYLKDLIIKSFKKTF